LSNYVKPNEDIESAVSELYTNISSPVMTDISIVFSNTDVRTTYPEKLPDLFSGNQLVWVGKYNKAGKSKLTISGKIAGKQKTFSYDVDFESFEDNGVNDYIQNLWASRRVGYLIDQIDLNGKQTEWIDELVSLSKEFGILTPYTAYLAKEEMFAADNNILINRSSVQLDMLPNNIVGSQANVLRQQKKRLSSLPTVSESVAEDGFVQYEDSQGNSVDVNNIRKIGSKTFYLQNKLWVESTIEIKEIAGAVNVQKFSDLYFKISANQQAELNTYLSEDIEMVVRLNGVVYQFNN
jgi:Ca-activated chloride channel family protein